MKYWLETEREKKIRAMPQRADDQLPDRVFEDDNAGYIMEWKNPTRFMVFEHHPCRMGNPRKSSIMIGDIFRGSYESLEYAKVMLYKGVSDGNTI